jgi:O-antigen/teichoic acid export membrane protein
LNKKFLGQSMAYALASIAPILVNFAVTPFVTRILGPESYGVVAISISLFQFGIVVLTLGLAAAITRQAIIGRTGAAGAVATVVLGAACALLVFLFAWFLLPCWGPLILPGLEVGVLISPLMSCLGLAFLQNAQSFFRAEQRVATFVGLGAAASLAAPLVGITVVLLVEKSPATYLAGLAGTHLSIGLLAILTCLRMRRPQFRRGDFSTSLRIGLPTVPHQVATSFVALILVVATSHASGLDGAGALQLGMLMGTAPLLLLGAFNNAWAPLIYRASDESREGLLASSYRSFMLLTVVLVFGFAGLAPFVVPLVAGPLADMFPVTQVALIAALGAPFMTSYLANIHLVFLSGRTSALAITTPLSAAAALAVVTVPGLFSVQGDIRLFALALPIFQIFQLLVSIKLRRKRSDLRLPSVALIPEFIVVVMMLLTAYVLNGRIELVLVIEVILLAGLAWHRRRLIDRYLRNQRILSAQL